MPERPRKETIQNLPPTASHSEKVERTRLRGAQFADPGNMDEVNPDRAKWGWIAAAIIIIAGIGVDIYDSIAGAPPGE
ncbi:MAG: hypothetical protein ACPHK0_07305 [Dehalococcoidia bacterium]